MFKKVFFWLSDHFAIGIIIYCATALGIPEFLKTLGANTTAFAVEGFFQISENVNWKPIYLLALLVSLNWLIVANFGFIKNLFKSTRWNICGLDATDYIAVETPYGRSFDSEYDARLGAAQYLLALAKQGKISIFGKKSHLPEVTLIPKKKIPEGSLRPIKNMLIFDGGENFPYINVFFNKEQILKLCPPNENYSHNHWRI